MKNDVVCVCCVCMYVCVCKQGEEVSAGIILTILFLAMQ